MGEQTSPAIDDGTPVDHVERIFEVSAHDSILVNFKPLYKKTSYIVCSGVKSFAFTLRATYSIK